MTDEPFVLQNAPPAPKPATFTTPDEKQRVLFSGLMCCSGQQDLFDDIDKPEDESRNSFLNPKESLT